MNKWLPILLLLLPAGALAADWSGSVTALSDYRDRGVSVSAGDPAVQGVLDLDLDRHWRLSGFASSLKGDRRGDAELDFGASYGGDLGAMGFWSLGGQGVFYPGKAGGDQAEAFGAAGLDYGLLVGSLGFTYAPENDNLYLDARLDADWPGKPFGLSLAAGHESFRTRPDKWDWSAGVFYRFDAVTARLRYADSDRVGTGAAVLFGLSFGF